MCESYKKKKKKERNERERKKSKGVSIRGESGRIIVRKWNHWNHVRAVRFAVHISSPAVFFRPAMINRDYSRNIRGPSTPYIRTVIYSFELCFAQNNQSNHIFKRICKQAHISESFYAFMNSIYLPLRVDGACTRLIFTRISDAFWKINTLSDAKQLRYPELALSRHLSFARFSRNGALSCSISFDSKVAS